MYTIHLALTNDTDKRMTRRVCSVYDCTSVRAMETVGIITEIIRVDSPHTITATESVLVPLGEANTNSHVELTSCRLPCL